MAAKPFWKRNTSSKAQKEIARIAAGSGLDHKAINILFNSFYDEDEELMSWVERFNPPAQDLEYAIAQGVMVAPDQVLGHDDYLAQLIKQRDALDRKRVAAAFAVSLRTQRLELRSALGSYAAFLHLKQHQVVPGKSKRAYCELCGESTKEPRPVNRNSSAFVRLKWGGSIHHAMLEYAAFDLQAFSQANVPAVTKDDWQLLAEVFKAIAALPATAQLGELAKSFGGLFKSNKNERQHIAEIFGFCGILQPRGKPSLREEFVTYEVRSDDEPANANKREWRWPVQHWTGADGVNSAAIKFWFPEVK